MLTKIEVRNSAGDVLVLPFGEPINGVFIKSIEGIDPVKANIITSNYANQDGEQYQAARRSARNLKLNLGFAPDWVLTTPKEIRDMLYRWFMTKQQSELRFYEHTGLVVSIVGRCETNESPRMTSDPDAKIGIYCFLPDFIGMSNNNILGSSVSDTTESLVSYLGTEATGFLFTLNVNRSITSFSLSIHGVDNVQYQMDFILSSGNMVAGDVLRINTVQGSKFATLTRAGIETNVLHSISPASPWLKLRPGLNKIRLLISGIGAIPYSFNYTDKYGGL